MRSTVRLVALLRSQGLWTVAVPTVTEGGRKPLQPTAQKAVGSVLGGCQRLTAVMASDPSDGKRNGNTRLFSGNDGAFRLKGGKDSCEREATTTPTGPLPLAATNISKEPKQPLCKMSAPAAAESAELNM